MNYGGQTYHRVQILAPQICWLLTFLLSGVGKVLDPGLVTEASLAAGMVSFRHHSGVGMTPFL